MYAAHPAQRVAGPTQSVAGRAQVDSVQSPPPQDILFLAADFVAATLRKFITGHIDIDVTVAASTVCVVSESMRGVIIGKYLQDETPAPAPPASRRVRGPTPHITHPHHALMQISDFHTKT